jgi:hypothetical protein
MNNYYSIVAFVSLVGDWEVVIFPSQEKKSGDVGPVIFRSKKKGGDLPVPSKKNQEMLVR